MHALADQLLSVSRSVTVAAPLAQVLDAWSGPRAVARWFVERRCGDPLLDRQFIWYEPRATTRAGPPRPVPVRWLRFLNDGSVAGDATELRVGFDALPGATRVTVEHGRFAAERQPLLPRIASGWAAALALLKSYVEDGAGLPRRTCERVIDAPMSAAEFAHATAWTDAIAAWAGDQPSCLRMRSAYDAVFGLHGVPGLLSLHLGRRLVVSHTCWSAAPVPEGEVVVAQLAERLARRLAPCG